MDPGAALNVNTFPSHTFVATLGGPTGTRVGSWTMKQGVHEIDVGAGY